MLKILIADDHPVLRKGLKQILKESVSVARVYEAGDGVETLQILSDKQMDVVVLDISLPGKNGMIVLGEITRQFPDVSVLMLSIQPEEQYAARAFGLGAKGCLNKASAPEELVDAVKKVAGGGIFISDKTGNVLLDNIGRKNSLLPHQELSERETQVMLRIASGKTPSEIAEELCLSIKTISTYRSRLLEKMQLKNNAQLTQYVYKNKLITPSL